MMPIADIQAVYAAIGDEGFRALVDAFYRRAEADPILLPLFPPDLAKRLDRPDRRPVPAASDSRHLTSTLAEETRNATTTGPVLRRGRERAVSRRRAVDTRWGWNRARRGRGPSASPEGRQYGQQCGVGAL